MQWFLDLSHGLQAATILGVFATVCLAAVAHLRSGALAFLAMAAPLAAALPAILQPNGDSFAVVLVLAATFSCALLMRSEELADARQRAECVALQLLGAAGACVLVCANDWLSLLIGFESMSLAVAVLVGIGRGPRSLEVAFRFFVLSAVAAATLVYGIALFAYATGSFAIGASALAEPGMQAMATAAVVMAALGLAFELAIVPSHFGTLSVCFAAPLSCLTFAMTVSKVAAAIAMARLCVLHPQLQPIMVGLAIVTIVWSTFGGLAQTHLRGMLAYSAIGHGGFLALAAGCGQLASGTVAYYALVYAASIVLVLGALSGGSGDLPIAALARQPMGRMRRAALVLGLLSLAGVPPSPGFLAKLAVLRHSWEAAGVTCTVVAALGGVFGALFYLRPVPELLSDRSTSGTVTPTAVRVAIAMGALVSMLCMLAPQFAVRLAN